MGHQGNGMNLEVELLLDKCIVFDIGGVAQYVTLRDMLKQRTMVFPNFVLGQELVIVLADDVTNEDIQRKKAERDAALKAGVDVNILIAAAQNQGAMETLAMALQKTNNTNPEEVEMVHPITRPQDVAVVVPKKEPEAVEHDANGGFDIYESEEERDDESEAAATSPSHTILPENQEESEDEDIESILKAIQNSKPKKPEKRKSTRKNKAKVKPRKRKREEPSSEEEDDQDDEDYENDEAEQQHRNTLRNAETEDESEMSSPTCNSSDDGAVPARDKIFTKQFDKDKCVSSMTPLPLFGDEADAGMFGPYQIDGMRAFNERRDKEGNVFVTKNHQLTTFDALVEGYCGARTVFGAYGLEKWIYMGLGKTLITLAFIMYAARLLLPGLRICIDLDARDRWYNEVIAKAPINPKLKKLLGYMMYTEEAWKYVPDHEFTQIPTRRRGHALIVIPKSTHSAWIDELRLSFVKNKVKFIDLVDEAVLKKYTNKRDPKKLLRKIPKVHIVIVGEAILTTRRKNLLKNLGIKQMPSIENRVGDAFETDIGVLYGTAWNIVAFDEVHNARNSTKGRFKAFFDIFAHFTMCLTGTPFQNRLSDVQSLFMLLRMSHSPINQNTEFKTAMEKFRVIESAKLAMKLIADLTNEFQINAVSLRQGAVALKRDEIYDEIREIVRSKGVDRYNPTSKTGLMDLYLKRISSAMYRISEQYCKDITSVPMTSPVYQLEETFGNMYDAFLEGKFGENGKDMLTCTFPLVIGKATSMRLDHRLMRMKKVGRPEFLDAIQSGGLMCTADHRLLGEIKDLETQIAIKEKGIVGGLFSKLCTNLNKNLCEDEKLKLEQLKKAAGWDIDLSIFHELWKAENGLLYDVFTAYKRITSFYEDKDPVDWTIPPSFSIMDKISIGVMMYHKIKASEEFKKMWEICQQDDANLGTSPFMDKLCLDTCQDVLNAIENDPIGLVMNRSTIRYGEDTLYNMHFKELIEKKKLEVGRDLTDLELKEVADETMRRYGVVEKTVVSDFLDPQEKMVYDAIQTESLEELDNMVGIKMDRKKMYNRVFVMITRLKQCAVDCRLLTLKNSKKAAKNLLAMEAAFDPDNINGLDIVPRLMQENDENENEYEDDDAWAFWETIIEHVQKIKSFTKTRLLYMTLTDKEVIQTPQTKVLIFTYFKQMIKHIAEVVEGVFGEDSYVVMHGQTSRPDRDKNVHQFKTDPKIRVIIITLGTGSIGLNLQEADVVIMYDNWWNPQVEIQGLQRSRRMGREKFVTLIRFIIKNTVEMRTEAIKNEKMKLANAVIGGMDKPYILPTNAELMANGRVTLDKMIDILKGDKRTAELDEFDNMVKKRKAERTLKNKEKAAKLMKGQTFIDTSNWCITDTDTKRKRITEDNFHEISNKMAEEMSRSFD